jgi:hypothetical protein
MELRAFLMKRSVINARRLSKEENMVLSFSDSAFNPLESDHKPLPYIYVKRHLHLRLSREW